MSAATLDRDPAVMIQAMQARLGALARAVRTQQRGIERGQRVTFPLGAFGTFGTVEAVHEGDGEPYALVRVSGAWMHREPLHRLTAVCGVCADCMALNERPGCVV